MVKVRSSAKFSFMYHFIMLLLGDEVRVLVDKLHEIGELLAAVGRKLERFKLRSGG